MGELTLVGEKCVEEGLSIQPCAHCEGERCVHVQRDRLGAVGEKVHEESMVSRSVSRRFEESESLPCSTIVIPNIRN